jgi:hypothetical protein
MSQKKKLMVTVRMELPLREFLQKEAEEKCLSVNQLCINKLSAGMFVQPDKVPHAKVSWNAIDVQDKYRVTTERANEFLDNNSIRIQDAMVEAGWVAIETCAAMEELEELPDDE